MTLRQNQRKSLFYSIFWLFTQSCGRFLKRTKSHASRVYDRSKVLADLRAVADPRSVVFSSPIIFGEELIFGRRFFYLLCDLL